MSELPPEKIAEFRRGYRKVPVWYLPAFVAGFVITVGGLLTLMMAHIDGRYLVFGFVPGVLWFMVCAAKYLKYMNCPHCGSPLSKWAIVSLHETCYNCKGELQALLKEPATSASFNDG